MKNTVPLDEAMVCLATYLYVTARQTGISPVSPWDFFVSSGIPEEKVEVIFDRAVENDLIDYGVSIRAPFLTEKGRVLLNERYGLA